MKPDWMKTVPLRLNIQTLRTPANRVRPVQRLVSRRRTPGSPAEEKLMTGLCIRGELVQIHQMGNLLGTNMHREFTQSDKTHAKQINFICHCQSVTLV